MKTISMIGNAHLDPVWLWQWQEGYHEVKATFQAALDRLNETPGFVFTCACADYYRWVEENAPDIFAQIKERAAEGRWVIAGGMWIQPDMNTPSGESLARQLLYSQRYFHEKFGRTVRTGYNVDSFGHNAMTPQLLRCAGIENYVWMRPSVIENPDVPEGSMIWESPDGSQVYAHRIHNEYTCRTERLHDKIDLMFDFSQKLGQPVMCFYGVGDHGGGPTIETLKRLGAFQQSDPRGSEVVMSSPDEYFDQFRKENVSLPVWKNELQHHASGCYSTHSRSKKLHRMAENALLRMESLGVLSRALTGHQPKKPFVDQAWHNLLFNEFHDIMGGCSIRESMQDAEMQLNETLSIAAREENAALQRISWQIDTIKGHPLRRRSKEESFYLWGIQGQGTPVVVFNPHAFEAETPVRVLCRIASVRDDDGQPVPLQRVRASRTNGEDKWDGLFMARVPAFGWRLYWVFFEEEAQPESRLSVSEHHLENECLRAEFDPATGGLCALIRKQNGENALVSPASAQLRDISASDTWAHMIFKFDKPAGAFGQPEFTVLENGPVRAVLRVVTRYGRSVLDQRFTLYAGSDQLEVETHLDMQEAQRMLKLCFPTPYTDEIAEIPYGALRRTACGNEEHCQRWIALENGKAGLAVINDGKYSYSIENGTIALTVAHTSVYADHYGQDHRDETVEYMDTGRQVFRYALCPYGNGWQTAALNRRAALLNRPLPRVVETYHEGPLPGEYSGLSISDPSVDVSVIKRSEDDLGWVIRLSETTGQPRTAHISAAFASREMDAALSPFQLKTLYLPDDPAQSFSECLLTEL